MTVRVAVFTGLAASIPRGSPSLPGGYRHVRRFSASDYAKSTDTIGIPFVLLVECTYSERALFV